MAIEIKAPTFPESVADGLIASWHKQPGEAVIRDDLLVDIETDKVVLEIVAPGDGTLKEIIKAEGDIVLSNELIAIFEEGSAATTSKPQTVTDGGVDGSSSNDTGGEQLLSPAARKIAEENSLDPMSVAGTGKGGRITKEDVLKHLKNKPGATGSPVPVVKESVKSAPASVIDGETSVDSRFERRVPMTRLRAKIAERLLTASQETAMLTTFNEANMQPVMDLRNKYKETFEKVHNGTRLGFMSFFVRAAVDALKRFPIVNASIDGDDVVYHAYQDIGVAVSSPRGLVVPVLKDAEQMSLADIESTIRELGLKARDGKLTIDDMTGGTFTITNGGVFGSMMSTPILNPPQTGILGMHKIQDRPMAVDGQVVILPMMYLALSYDHRLVDGKDAVQFLVAIKDMLEDPARILLDI